jgi:hypothetical protein
MKLQPSDSWQRCQKHTFQKIEENWIMTCRRLKVNACLLPCIKINSKWIKHLNARPETLKQLEEDIGESLQDTDFVNRTPKVQEIKARVDKRSLVLVTVGSLQQGDHDPGQLGRKAGPYLQNNQSRSKG